LAVSDILFLFVENFVSFSDNVSVGFLAGFFAGFF
jgi:hypothetical protein